MGAALANGGACCVKQNASDGWVGSGFALGFCSQGHTARNDCLLTLIRITNSHYWSDVARQFRSLASTGLQTLTLPVREIMTNRL